MAADGASVCATDLRVEYVRAPIGLDEQNPNLSWKLAGSGRGLAATAYRIRVVVDGDPTEETVPAVWDSGVVESNVQNTTYAGMALTPRTRYSWAVRVVDEAGREGKWSAPSTFETGLFDDAEWRGGWVGSPTDHDGEAFRSLDSQGFQQPIARVWLPSADDPGPVPEPDGDQAYFRAHFTVPEAAVERVRLLAAGAESVQGWLNGTPLAVDGSADPAVAQAVVAGSNVLAIAAVASPDETPGLVARLEVQLVGEPAVQVFSSGQWRVASIAAPGWEREDHADDDWKFAEAYGAHGEAPRGREPITYRPSPYLRRDFSLDQEIRSARLYATALGIYEARINGQRVGDDHFAPGWTDYDARVPYQTHDVTGLLKSGANTIGAVLADGWYAGNICWFGPFQYGTRRAFRAHLEVEYADGSRVVVGTDESWRAGEGGVRFADLQNGAVVDARAEPIGWDSPGFDGGSWSPVEVLQPAHGPLEAQVAPAIRVDRELPALRVDHRGPGRYIVDFGQNLVGWTRLRLSGPAGARVLIRHAEVLDHRGELYLEALRSALCTDEYVLAGDGGEIFEPKFTVHGFRYAEIVGHPGELAAADITAQVAFAAMDQHGEFACSDDRLNKLQSNIVWGQRGNFLSVPTDCPQRDERLGWTGDAQVFTPTAAFNYDVRGFFRKWLRDLADGQKDDGAVPHVAPDVLSPHGFVAGPEGHAAGAAGWGDAVEVIPSELLEAYGDARFAAETFDGIAAWLDYLEAHSDGLIRPDDGFADWLAPTGTPRDLVQTAYFAQAARVSAALAEHLGRTEERRRWTDLYGRVRSAFRARFVRGGGEVGTGSQTAYLLALRFELLDPEEVPRAAERLVQELASRNWHLATGFLGTPFLLPVLSSTGHLDAAYRLLLQDTVPSWLYPVVHGDATTIWERWDSWSDSLGFQDPNMTSFNHYAYGAVGDWMYRTVGGLAPGAPGYAVVRVAPEPGGGLTWARASLETVYGHTATHWTLAEDGAFTLEVTVPPGATGEVVLPTADASRATEGGRSLDQIDGVTAVEPGDGDRLTVRVGSGTYAFAVSPAA